MGNMMAVSISHKAIEKQVKKIAKDHAAKSKTAEIRSLNIITRRGVAKIARDIREETGHKISTVKRAIKTRKANRSQQYTVLNVSGRRLQYPGVRVIKRKGKPAGVSYLGRGKRRVKELNPISGGSRLFLIEAQNSQKKIAVYRKVGHKRKVTTFAGHSIPYLLRYSWDNWLKSWVKKELAKEYPKQLKKAKFR
jgi:hypothetical protein